METGKIKIHKSGKVKKFTNSLGKGVSVPAIFDFSQFSPDSGTKDYDCELEIDEKGRAVKIIINGIEIGEDTKLKKDRQAKEQKKKDDAKREELSKKDAEKNRNLIEFKKGNFVYISESFLPKDTTDLLSNKEYIVDNFNLELNKLPRYEAGKFHFYKKERYTPKPNFSMDLINQIAINEQSTVKSLFMNETSFNIINFKPNWRLIVGLGGESVYETSITLHHIYGIPYIPASSIKGVVRSWIINTVFGDKDLHFAEGLAIQDKSFCDFFGCPAEIRIDTTKFKSYYTQTEGKKKGDRSGKVIFLDAFPTTEPNLEVDIMNPHYPKYYGKDKPPTDFQNPVPIFFLTVKDTSFQFIVGTKENSLQDYKINNNSIVEWLKEALSVHGIGAKTAVSYGRMSELKEN